MGSLVYSIAAISAAQFGVNVLEQSPPGGVRGSGTNIVAMVADLPWGPVDTVVEIGSPGEFFDKFCPLAFGAQNSYPALRAVLNKTFPSILKVVRISPTGQVAATKTYNDAVAAASVKVDAKYAGVLGNSITVAWAANADDPTARDATVAIGTAYSVTYKQVAKIVSAALVVTDPGDPYVVFSKASPGTAVPVAAAAAALATGADGTAAAADYTTSMAELASASVEWHVGFCAEVASGILDATNTAVKTFLDANPNRGIWVYSTPASQSSSTAKTYVSASYRSDRAVYVWPRVKTINGFDTARGEITVDGNAFAAVAIASVDPEKSPGGAPGAPYLRGITGLEQGATGTVLNDLNANGITPFFMSTAMEGAILHNAVLTTLTAGKTKVFRRRMTDYLMSSIAAFLERFTGELLDIDLANRALGDVTGPEVGQIVQFLADLVTTGRLRQYAVDPFGANTQSNIDAGTFIIKVDAKLFSAQEKIVLLANIGETVTITEA